MQRVARGCAYSVGVVLVGILVLVAVQWTYVAYQRASNIWWQSDTEIEAHLLRQSSLGSTEVEVVGWLKSQGIADPHIVRFLRTVEPEEFVRHGFFNAKARSTSMIQTGVASYGFPFTTTVEVFYLFDNERLVDLGVRKTTDAF